MIKNFTPRLYQETIFATAVGKNTLVVLPTGMGKTNIFLMLAAHRLKQHPNSKILLIGPTRPLIDQYYEVFKTHFEINEKEMAILTGFVSPEKRAELWKNAKIIFSTPQGLENDIISNRINLKEVSLLGVDEAHRAVGNYAYAFIAKQYKKLADFPRIIGMTASPGSKLEQIEEVCKNLFIEEIEARTLEDPDVKPYIQDIDVEWIKTELPEEFIEIKQFLEECLKSKIENVKKLGLVRNNISTNKKELLNIQAALHAQLAQGEKDFITLRTVSLLAEIMKAQHALELIETEGITTLQKYFTKLQEEARTTKTKAVKNLVADLNFKSAWIKTTHLYEKGVEHPKLNELKKVINNEISNNKEIKVIVFTQYRDSALKIAEELNKTAGVSAKIFVGQMKKGETGMSQKEQKQMLDSFREGSFNVLVATSIGEEGLDIPKVDLVIFYEPIPSAIRTIQRRGRTGRQEQGRVIILMTKNTRDEAYHWVARHKEKQMFRTIDKIRNKLKFKKEPTLKDYIKEDNTKIFADIREKGGGTIKELAENGIKLELKRLDTADYILSSRVGVEVKTVPDFVNSIIDGRLLQQARMLRENFEKPIMIIEGQEDIYSVRRVHPNAIRGMIATIAVSYGIPLIQTKNSKETAALLIAIAKREQNETKRDYEMHQQKPLTLKEQQEYIISSLPGIGLNLAKPLLKKFGTIKNIANAEEKELKEVEQIGEKKAKEIRRIMDEEYKE